MSTPFYKDLHNVSWTEIYRRQEVRAPLVPGWIDALRLKTGSRVLDVGCGPGFVTLKMGARVGPGGLVLAVDRSATALRMLMRRRDRQKLSAIVPLTADILKLRRPPLPRVDCALISMVLHHVDDPRAILRTVHTLVPPGAPVVVGEFHPDGPCNSGPPHEARLMPDTVGDWCARAGFRLCGYDRQTTEHYMLTLMR